MLFSSQTLFMLHHKVWSSQIRTTLYEEHSESPIRHRLKLPKPLCAFRYDRFILFGLTDSSFSVWPSSLSWSRFSILVQPIRTFRSHRVAVTARSFAPWCHQVVPLGHTDRVRIYILTGEILEISSNSSARACVLLCLLGSPDRLIAASNLSPLVSITVNGNLFHCCHRSEPPPN